MFIGMTLLLEVDLRVGLGKIVRKRKSSGKKYKIFYNILLTNLCGNLESRG